MNLGEFGTPASNFGVHGVAGGPSGSHPTRPRGVYGESLNGIGVAGVSHDDAGVSGASFDDSGVEGWSKNRNGVFAHSDTGIGLVVEGAQTAATFDGDLSVDGDAACVNLVVSAGLTVGGNLTVKGRLTKSAGSFRIDHPLDPVNKDLFHSFVESPDMLNIYSGEVTLDTFGEAHVELPVWFEALNRDFRYQLTSIGGPAPNLHVAETIRHNRFGIAGGSLGLAVSWQVTGVRHDAYAEAHRIPVEVCKAEIGRASEPSQMDGRPVSKSTDVVTPDWQRILTRLVAYKQVGDFMARARCLIRLFRAPTLHAAHKRDSPAAAER
jgi:hypothetical protein